MAKSYILILIIPFLLFVSSLAYGTEFYAEIDKSEYFVEETIIVSGEVAELAEYSQSVTMVVVSPNGNIAAIIQVVPSEDKTFNFEFYIPEGSEVGTYEIRFQYGDARIETTFELLSGELPISKIQIFTDKSSYNELETISITGDLINIDTRYIDRVKITMHDEDTNIMMPEYSGSITDNTFSHSITTDDEVWNNYLGDVTIEATFQDYHDSIIISYSPYPLNLSDEYLHDLLKDHDNELTIQKEMILSLQEEFAAHNELHDETPDDTPDEEELVAPIIIELIADDPDNGDDIFGVGDTISIIFDSDTNMPGGSDTLRKPLTDNLFTLSDYLGSAYSGEWINPYTFVITIKNSNSALIAINSTTVTPAQITLILPADENPVNFSYETSPVLSGDWGTPTQ